MKRNIHALAEFLDLDVSKLSLHGRTNVNLQSNPACLLTVIIQQIGSDLRVGPSGCISEISHNLSKLFPVVNRCDEKIFHLADSGILFA